MEFINIISSAIDYKTKKKLLSDEIKKEINEVIQIAKKIEKNYKIFRKSTSKEKAIIRGEVKELLKILHAKFSKIETILRSIDQEAIKNNKILKKEKIPVFKDYIEMTESKFNKFRKLDENEKRMIVWIELFIKKLRYMRDLIIRDIDKEKENKEKIKIINKFYAQISVVGKIFDGDAFMLGAPYKKIKIIKPKGKKNEK